MSAASYASIRSAPLFQLLTRPALSTVNSA